MGGEQSRGTNGAATEGIAVAHGVSTLGPNLQKRFSKGIQYNMKIALKGDRNVGKTSLFHRLQGQPFNETYTPTPEIQVACIQWNYKVTDDIVKVEIWDIVDKGKTRKREGLKVDTEDTVPTLDAEFIDVYKGTSGVIMVLDITKYWTYEYIQKELPKIPLDIPVIIMASHRDMEDSRSVLTEDVQSYIQELNRPAHAAEVYYMEASMKDGFGLKYLYRFFNVPFLELQRQTLLTQLRRNEEDLEAIKVELDVHAKAEEQDYDRFTELVDRKRRGIPAGGLCTVAAGANETAEQGADPSVLEDGTTMSLRNRLSPRVLQNAPLPAKVAHLGPETPKQRIDNFKPEGKLDNNFLASSQLSREPSPRASPKQSRSKMADIYISDSDDDIHCNPQVTLDQESPDEADMGTVYKQADSKQSVQSDPVVLEDGELDVTYTVPTRHKGGQPPTVIHAPAPLQSIDPIASPKILEPISTEKTENDELSSPIATPDDNSAREKSNVTSSDHVTSRPNHVTPYLDLDALDQISKAPPIEIQGTKQSRDRSKSPKPKKPPKKSPKVEKKRPPPKKKLMDISLTSSDEDASEDEENTPLPQEPVVEVLATFDEPEVIRPKRTGSLKLAHTEPEVYTPPPAPVHHEAPQKTKHKRQTKQPAEEPKRTSMDELDDFFGEPTSKTKKTKKKTMKNKKKASAVVGDYEEF